VRHGSASAPPDLADHAYRHGCVLCSSRLGRSGREAPMSKQPSQPPTSKDWTMRVVHLAPVTPPTNHIRSCTTSTSEPSAVSLKTGADGRIC
jgi:hypothetical protein